MGFLVGVEVQILAGPCTAPASAAGLGSAVSPLRLERAKPGVIAAAMRIRPLVDAEMGQAG